MKTTNYEISRQLAEAKFKANQVWNQEGKFWGYDLETILEVLPKEIKKLHFWATWSTSSDCYIFGYIDGIVRNTELETATEENESLADTAAKMWLKLKKDNLI